MNERRFGLVGAGRVGLALMRHAVEYGFSFTWGVDRTPSQLRASNAGAQMEFSTGFDGLDRTPVDLCIIAVPDEEIASVSRELAKRRVLPVGCLAFHTSGSRDASELDALEAAGVITGSIHPIQSFSDTGGATSVNGIGCGIEGSDRFYERAFELAERFGWHPLRIATEHKPLYHAACVFAGNFPTVLAAQADELLRAAVVGDPTNTLPWILPMMRTVIDRLADHTPQDTLTGPAARGQFEALREHISQLATKHPTLTDSYRVLSEAAASLAGLDNDALEKVRRILGGTRNQD